MDQDLEAQNKLVFGYKILRSVIGIMGIALPFTVAILGFVIFHTKLQASVSSYYHTPMRDVFVGALWAIGFFLLSYQGYTREDNRASNLACIFAVLVALFPTKPEGDVSNLVKWISNIHLASAAGFFLTLTFIAWRQFTISKDELGPTPEKLLRNKIYRTCAIVMVVCLGLIVLYGIEPIKIAINNLINIEAIAPLFLLETFAIVAFGVSWLTKGEALKFLRDKPDSVRQRPSS